MILAQNKHDRVGNYPVVSYIPIIYILFLYGLGRMWYTEQ